MPGYLARFFSHLLVHLMQLCIHFLFIKIGKTGRVLQLVSGFMTEASLMQRQRGSCNCGRSALAGPHCPKAAFSVPGLLAQPHTAWKALTWNKEK